MISKRTSPDLDTFAWKAIREWPFMSASSFRDYDDDYAELARWFLWDKVGRAIRISSGSQTSALERELIVASNCSPEACLVESHFFHKQLRAQLNRLFALVWKKPEQQVPPASCFQRRSGPLVYVPVLSDRLKNAAGELIRQNICQVATRYAHQAIDGVALFQSALESRPDHDAAVSVYNAIVDGLKGFGITLLVGDEATLRSQVFDLTSHVKSVQSELETVQPDAILVHGDNHPPFQAYVLAARKMGIPSIMLQHGLDCEQNYLDEAYASHIAVWGDERLRRYGDTSRWQPRMSVTGNPEYDHLRIPEKICCAGDYWLWVTRPHSPEKCYAPSRNPQEGVDILHAILEALNKGPKIRLLIKTHPYDYREPYEKIIAAQRLQGRVQLSTRNLSELFPHASLVITEDSTAGLDAMFAGKPLVHAHFAECKPTMPFVEYGAALPGFMKEQLVESLLRVSSFDQMEAQYFLTGQTAFIKDFAGPCDGNAGNRFVGFVEEILCQK